MIPKTKLLDLRVELNFLGCGSKQFGEIFESEFIERKNLGEDDGISNICSGTWSIIFPFDARADAQALLNRWMNGRIKDQDLIGYKGDEIRPTSQGLKYTKIEE